jgi:hypothetical protein
MAERGLFQTSDLVPLPAERGVHLSREQVYRLVTQPPRRLLRWSCEFLVASGASSVVVVGRWRDPAGARDFADGGGGDSVAEATELALDADCAPGSVLPREAQDEGGQFIADQWTTWRLGLLPPRGDQSAASLGQGWASLAGRWCRGTEAVDHQVDLPAGQAVPVAGARQWSGQE